MSTNRIESLRAAHQAACATRDSAIKQVNGLSDRATDQEAVPVIALFDKAQEEVERTKRNLDDAVALEGVRVPIVGDDVRGYAAARGSLRTEGTYRPDTPESFFRDLVHSAQDPGAQERLHRNQKQTLDQIGERRDITSTTVAGFVPPSYLGDLYAEMPRTARPFLNALPNRPLPDTGMSLVVPRVTTGSAVEIQASENAAVQETNPAVTDLTVTVGTIAGQVDVSRQAIDRSWPGIDQIIYADLQAAYDSKFDTQAISGSGSSGQHLGVSNVSSISTVSYTDASPTAAALVPKIYDAIQKVASARYRQPDMILLHPRRAAWLGSQMSSTFPLFQQGNLQQASGTQNGGFLTSFGGLRVVLDANVSTTLGAGTNEDQILLLNSEDVIVMEGAVQTVAFESVLSSTLTVRLQVYGYSALISGRFPSAICSLGGTGLATPAFA